MRWKSSQWKRASSKKGMNNSITFSLFSITTADRREMRSLLISPWAESMTSGGGHAVLPSFCSNLYFCPVDVVIIVSWRPALCHQTAMRASPRVRPPPITLPECHSRLHSSATFTHQLWTMSRSWHCPELPFHTWRTRQESVCVRRGLT